jgi:hypothetical protein
MLCIFPAATSTNRSSSADPGWSLGSLMISPCMNPQWYSALLSVINRVTLAPKDTSFTLWLIGTFRGPASSSVNPTPSPRHPFFPAPQIQTSLLLSITTALRAAPAYRRWTFFCYKLMISVGNYWSSKFSYPSLPRSPIPQLNTFLFLLSARLC